MKYKKKLIEEEEKAKKQYKNIEKAINSAFEYVEDLKKQGKVNSKSDFKVSFY